MNTDEDKKIIVEKHINMMMETLQILDEKALIEVVDINEKPKKKDTRDRSENRKEYMKKYYAVHKVKINERSNKSYVSKKDKKQIEKQIEKTE